MAFLDSVEIEIPCARCHHKTKKTLGWVKANKQFTCVCGEIILLNADQAIRATDDFNKAVDDLGKSLKKL